VRFNTARCLRHDALRVEMSQSAKPIRAHDAQRRKGFVLMNSTKVLVRVGFFRAAYVYTAVYAICVNTICNVQDFSRGKN